MKNLTTLLLILTFNFAISQTVVDVLQAPVQYEDRNDYTYSQVDSTYHDGVLYSIKFYTYNADGNVLTEIEDGDADGTPDYSVENTYDSEGIEYLQQKTITRMELLIIYLHTPMMLTEII